MAATGAPSSIKWSGPDEMDGRRPENWDVGRLFQPQATEITIVVGSALVARTALPTTDAETGSASGGGAH
ncbi:hypothetical protein [Plantactinospora soyae]|uniref:Uncharacterized protein n=1 Tax=Plantactinospora soyae TaxID=1544732 RepID=A0A927QZG9_9ACTN|nr:hypothetical protein [Plantactinospora soyae]MBE1487588.1 hypothetical protein [Plantactinospora soyae]